MIRPASSALRRLLPTLLALTLLGAACGSSSSAERSDTSSAGGGSSSALQFEATTLDGTAVDGATYAGRPVAFWFWAPT